MLNRFQHPRALSTCNPAFWLRCTRQCLSKLSASRIKHYLRPKLPLFIRKNWRLKRLAQFSENSKPYELPALADSILERGMSLIGTRYRFGGTSEAGFDCSGFIGYLFREEAGMQLPRSTREMINVKAPLVARNKLKPE